MSFSRLRRSGATAHAAVVLFIAAASASMTACSEGGTEPPGGGRQTVEGVAINPASAPVMLGSTLQLSASAVDAQGAEVTGRQVFWASADTTVAVVSETGIVTARRLGAVQIQAVVDGKPAYSLVTVVSRPVGSVAVTPATQSVAAGASVQLQATVRDDQGAVLTGRAVTWLSSNDAIARVTSTGLVLGSAPGSASITATAGDKNGTAAVTVTGTVATPPPGGGPVTVARVAVQPSPTAGVRLNENLQLTVTAFDAANNIITGRTVAWTSNNTGIAGVDNTGKVRGNAVGTATISATVDGRTGSTSVTVEAPPPASVARVDVAPSTATVSVGATQPLSATVRDAAGGVLGDRAVTWSSSRPDVATVSGSGVVTAVAQGTAMISAASEGVIGTATVTVPAPAPARVTRVDVTPGSATVAVGATQTLTATPRDAGGAALTGRTVTWSSSANGVATVNASGVVTAVAAGTATITATSEGVSGTATITVPAPTTAVVEVAPNSKSLVVGQTQQLTATPRTASGAPLSGRPVAWTSTNTSVATVNNAGLVTAVAAGTATIRATIDGVIGSSAITVTAVPVFRVAVVPKTWTMKKGDTKQVIVTAYDADNRVLAGRACTLSYTASGPAVISIAAGTGVVTGLRAGTALVVATCEGKSDTATFTIED